MSYSELLKDPRWQKKRLEIFERDNWTCQCCLDVDSTLHVHHTKYQGTNPWDTSNNYLLTLCESCHSNEERLKSFDLYSIVDDCRITRYQLILLMNHVRYRIDALDDDNDRFRNFNDEVLRRLVPSSELSVYIDKMPKNG